MKISLHGSLIRQPVKRHGKESNKCPSDLLIMRINGRRKGWMNEKVHKLKHEWMHVLMNEYVYEWMNELMNQQMNEGIN